VLQAIKAREAESARRCMATLLQDSIDDVRRALGKNPRANAPALSKT
jgi:DNA-binding GntR family transcriptional regulator